MDYNTLIDKINYLKNKYNNLAVITKSIDEAKEILENIKGSIDYINIVDIDSTKYNKDYVIIPAYAAKGLEFDSVIIINNFNNDKYLFYVAVTRSQHELIVFNK